MFIFDVTYHTILILNIYIYLYNLECNCKTIILKFVYCSQVDNVFGVKIITKSILIYIYINKVIFNHQKAVSTYIIKMFIFFHYYLPRCI